MPKVIIDGKEIEVPEGTTILNAARMIGGDVVPPAMCYYSSLKGSGGKCRTCLVEVSKGSEKDPRPMPKLVASCSTPIMDGMEVKNKTSNRVTDARNGVVEFLLLNHPLDCPVCDQAGECHLQDLAYDHGKEGTRYEFKRREFDKIDIGPYIKLHMTRCILCYRCVYTANQLTDQREHGVLKRGDASEISTFIENSLDNEFIGNVIDVCPVGALTDRTFRFKSRVWYTKPMNVHRNCTKCSGKAVAWMIGDDIARVTSRKDAFGEVEKDAEGKPEFICNDCRFHTKETNQWTVEGPRHIDRNSVIGAGHYEKEIPSHTALLNKA